MPVRSLRSSVQKWPSKTDTLAAFRTWARLQGKKRRDIAKIGCFGSLARGTWGVGSDLDIVIILSESKLPALRRSIEWDTTSLPVHSDVVVLTQKEAREKVSTKFKRVLEHETLWV